MIPDSVSFKLTKEVSISIGQDRTVMLRVGDERHYIQDTNFGSFLLDRTHGRPHAAPYRTLPLQGVGSIQ
jgi:hypothetical protein